MENFNDFISNHFWVITLYVLSFISIGCMWGVFAEYHMKINWIRDYWGPKEMETTGRTLKRKLFWREMTLITVSISLFLAATAILLDK